jgi:diacylglycerol kinase family enzyme
MARLALLLAALTVLTLLVSAGIRSVALLAAGAAALVVTTAALWWFLAHRGPIRLASAVLAAAAPAAAAFYFIAVGLLWTVLVCGALAVVTLWTARTALRTASEFLATAYPAARPQRPFLIMNPRSGGGKVGRFGLAEKARALGADVVVLDPAHPQDVAELARRAVAGGADLLGVAGGDGTQALVAGVAARNDVPFVVIAAGTRNHFALDLGLDRDDPSSCLDALTDGVELRVDLGRVAGRTFVNDASFGAYAAVVQSPAYREDKVRTALQMLPDLLTEHRGPKLTVRAGNVLIEEPQAVLVSNNPYQGGDVAGLGRRARLDGGVLGVLGVRVEGAAQAAGLLRGRRGRGLTTLTACSVAIDSDASEVPVGVDGEALALRPPIVCEISPGALRVRVPRSRRGAPPPPMDWQRLWSVAFGR